MAKTKFYKRQKIHRANDRYGTLYTKDYIKLPEKINMWRKSPLWSKRSEADKKNGKKK